MKLLVVLTVLLTVHRIYALNEAQIKAAAKLIRNTCQQKLKLSGELIDDMHKGTWTDDQKVKCYTNCCLTMMKMGKKSGEFDLELAVPNLARLPEPRLAPTKESMTKCKDAGEGLTDKCDLSYAFFKCMYFDNPENYFLP